MIFQIHLRCFSLKNGQRIWNIKTENTLIKSQKKISIVINNDNVIFNNSIGDISAVDKKKWNFELATTNSNNLIYESIFSLKNSEI